MKVKARPILIVGHESTYAHPVNIDYEFLPISTLKNVIPDPVYDILVDDNFRQEINLSEISYIRTHKTSWTHSSNIDLRQISNIKQTHPHFYNLLIEKNELWMSTRSISSKAEVSTAN